MISIFQFVRDESAVTAVEYALIASLIAAVIVGAVASLSTSLNGVFQFIHNAVSAI
jgi:pilus assembly protein Flp/PilA